MDRGGTATTESKVSAAERQKLEAEAAMYWTQVGKGIIDVAVEEGLWLALMIDMAAISGKVYHYTYDEKGNRHGNFLWSQRYRMVKTLKFITDKTINLRGMWDAPNPFSYVFGFIEPLKDALNEKATEESAVTISTAPQTITDPGGPLAPWQPPPAPRPGPTTRVVTMSREYYVPLEPIPRMMCIFMLPGILRILVRKIEGMSIA